MAELKDYATVAANNNSASPDGMPENMAPDGINNSWREGIARLKRWYTDINFITTATDITGGVNSSTWTLTPAKTVGTLTDDTLFAFIAPAVSNLGRLNLNVSNLGNKDVTKFGGATLSASDINSGQLVFVGYDKGNDRFDLLNLPSLLGNPLALKLGGTGHSTSASILWTVASGGTGHSTTASVRAIMNFHANTDLNFTITDVNTYTKIKINNFLRDNSGGEFHTATSGFVTDVPGTYLFTANIEAAAADNTSLDIAIFKDGSLQVQANTSLKSATNKSQTITYIDEITVTASHTYAVFGRSGTANTQYNVTNTWFQGVRIN